MPLENQFSHDNRLEHWPFKQFFIHKSIAQNRSNGSIYYRLYNARWVKFSLFPYLLCHALTCLYESCQKYSEIPRKIIGPRRAKYEKKIYPWIRWKCSLDDNNHNYSTNNILSISNDLSLWNFYSNDFNGWGRWICETPRLVLTLLLTFEVKRELVRTEWRAHEIQRNSVWAWIFLWYVWRYVQLSPRSKRRCVCNCELTSGWFTAVNLNTTANAVYMSEFKRYFLSKPYNCCLSSDFCPWNNEK